MEVWGGGPNGVQGQIPLSGGQRDEVPMKLMTFSFSETNFLTKLSHKLGKFRLHGERQRCLREHTCRWWGTIQLSTYFYIRPRPTATAC